MKNTSETTNRATGGATTHERTNVFVGMVALGLVVAVAVQILSGAGFLRVLIASLVLGMVAVLASSERMKAFARRRPRAAGFALALSTGLTVIQVFEPGLSLSLEYSFFCS